MKNFEYLDWNEKTCIYGLENENGQQLYVYVSFDEIDSDIKGYDFYDDGTFEWEEYDNYPYSNDSGSYPVWLTKEGMKKIQVKTTIELEEDKEIPTEFDDKETLNAIIEDAIARFIEDVQRENY